MEEQIYYIDQSFIDYMMSSAYTDYLTSGKYDPDNKYARMAAEYNETFVFPVQDISDMERPVPVGIYLDGSKAIKESGSYTETVPIAGVVINTQKQENAKKFIEYLRQK
jgi:ABC-type Fe3+ transport system substrate-binding protein